MKKTFALLAAGASIAFVAAAHADDKEAIKAETSIEQKDNGGYEKSTTRSHSDAAGTMHKSKSTTEVSVDDDGETKKTVENETSTDPKGLMNKTTAKTKQVTKTDAAGNKTVETKKTVNGETIQDSKTAR